MIIFDKAISDIFLMYMKIIDVVYVNVLELKQLVYKFLESRPYAW